MADKARARLARALDVDPSAILYEGGDKDNSADEDETFVFQATGELAQSLESPDGFDPDADEISVAFRVTIDGKNYVRRRTLDLGAIPAGKNFGDAVASAIAAIGRAYYSREQSIRLLGVGWRPAEPESVPQGAESEGAPLPAEDEGTMLPPGAPPPAPLPAPESPPAPAPPPSLPPNLDNRERIERERERRRLEAERKERERREREQERERERERKRPRKRPQAPRDDTPGPNLIERVASAVAGAVRGIGRALRGFFGG